MSTPHRRPSPLVVGAATLSILLVALPLAGLLRRAAWSTLMADLGSDTSLRALRLSLVCSLAAAGLSVVLGTPLAWVLARVRFPGRSVVRGLVLLPLVLPPVVGGVALLAAFSRRGLVGEPLHDLLGVQLTFTTPGAVLAETFVALPFYVITLEAGLRSLDGRFEEAATTLGGRPWFVARRVTFPLLAPTVVAGAVLAWARALGEFGATVTFAGNVEGRTRTLPLEVYLQLDANPDAAVALSLLLLVVSIAVIAGLRDRWWARS